MIRIYFEDDSERNLVAVLSEEHLHYLGPSLRLIAAKDNLHMTTSEQPGISMDSIDSTIEHCIEEMNELHSEHIAETMISIAKENGEI